MAVVSDGTLARYIQDEVLGIEPLDRAMLQPASIDLKLGPEILYNKDFHSRPEWTEFIDLNDVKGTAAFRPWGKFTMGDVGYPLAPGEFCLATTVEYVSIPDGLVARVEGKSSLGRIGLLIHATAGFIDPGFKGRITLELCNLHTRTIILRPNKPICQLSVLTLDWPAQRPYGHAELNSKYQDQKTVTESRYDG